MDSYEAKFLREALDKMAEAQAALTIAFRMVQYSAVPDDKDTIEGQRHAVNVVSGDGQEPSTA